MIDALSGEENYLKVAHSLLTKPVIAKMPTFIQPTKPVALEVPTTITTHNNARQLEQWKPTIEWCTKASAVIHPIGTNGKLDYWLQHLDQLDERATLLAQKTHARLPLFLRTRLEASKQTHWVWDSLVEDFLKRISVLAILSNHEHECLDTLTERDSLINEHVSVYPKAEGELGSLDGCYLAEDSGRLCIIRSGMATKTFKKRWGEHVRTSLRASTETAYRNFYWFYPHQREAHNVPGRRGVFQQINQRVGLGMRRQDKAKVLSLFNWRQSVLGELKELKLGPNHVGSVSDKQYRHLCYMLESFYAIGIKDIENITQNPGCEWQLRLYSSNKHQ